MKQYQFIDIFQGLGGREFPVIADFGEEGPKPGKFAVWAWAYFVDGEIVLKGFDPADLLRWERDSVAEVEFDDLYEALQYLTEEIAARADIPLWYES